MVTTTMTTIIAITTTFPTITGTMYLAYHLQSEKVQEKMYHTLNTVQDEMHHTLNTVQDEMHHTLNTVQDEMHHTLNTSPV